MVETAPDPADVPDHLLPVGTVEVLQLGLHESKGVFNTRKSFINLEKTQSSEPVYSSLNL